MSRASTPKNARLIAAPPRCRIPACSTSARSSPRMRALQPDKIGARDSKRALTFAQWNERSNSLANALLGLGLVEGRPRCAARLQLRRVARTVCGAGQGRAGRGAGQLPPDAGGDRIHRRQLRGARDGRAGRVARKHRAGAREPAADRQGCLGAFRRHADAAGLARLRSAGAGRRGPHAGGRSDATRYLGADVHVGHHRPAQGSDPQPPGQCTDLAGDRAGHGAVDAATPRCW